MEINCINIYEEPLFESISYIHLYVEGVAYTLDSSLYDGSFEYSLHEFGFKILYKKGFNKFIELISNKRFDFDICFTNYHGNTLLVRSFNCLFSKAEFEDSFRTATLYFDCAFSSIEDSSTDEFDYLSSEAI